MKQVQILGTDGNKYRCSDNVSRTPIGNAQHNVNSWAWCDGEFLLGGQQFSSHAPYVPSNDSECILELMESDSGDGVGYIALLEIKNGSLVEIDRATLKFSLIDDVHTVSYQYFVYDSKSMFFVNPVGGMKEYKKISNSGVEDMQFQSKYDINDLSSLRIDSNGGLECITTICRADTGYLPDSSYYTLHNIIDKIVTFKDGNFSDVDVSVPTHGDYCVNVNSVYDIYKKSHITYIIALTDPFIDPDTSNTHYHIINCISSANKDYQEYSINLSGSKYSLQIGVSDDYFLQKDIEFINNDGGAKGKYSLIGNDKRINLVDDRLFAYEQKDLYANPTTMPTLNVGKKYMLLTNSYPTNYYLSRKRFLIDLKTNEVVWSDPDRIHVANVNSPLITKKQAKKLLDLIKNMK